MTVPRVLFRVNRDGDEEDTAGGDWLEAEREAVQHIMREWMSWGGGAME